MNAYEEILDRMLEEALDNAEGTISEGTWEKEINHAGSLLELKMKSKEAESRKTIDWIRIAEIAVPAGVSLIGFAVNAGLIRSALRYEETGVYSHPTIKSMIGKIRIGK